MIDSTQPSRSLRNLQTTAENGNLLSLFELYQGYLSGKLAGDENPELAHVYLDKLKKSIVASRFSLTDLTLNGFRRYQNLEIEFDHKLTVIVGENGVGKTSIVEAVAKLLSWFGNRFIKANSSGIHLANDDLNVAVTDYVQITASFALNNHTPFLLSLARPLAGWVGEVSSELESSVLLGYLYRLLADQDQQFELPVFAFYSVDRSSIPIPRTVTETQLKKRFGSRFNFYADIYRAQSRAGYFIERYVELHNLATYGQGPYKQHLQHVNRAIETAVPFMTNLDIDRSGGKAEVKVDNFGNRINFLSLSQGQKTLAAMVGDLATRMIGLNPQMKNPLAAKGIVLIDEIDLHLHPTLQQQILLGLQKTFCGIQWVVTTHSPHVLSTVDKKCIRIVNVDDDRAVITTPDFQTKGVISSSVLEQIMGTHAVPETPESEWICTYMSLIQNHKWETPEAKTLYQELLGHFGSKHPVMEELTSQIRVEKLKQKLASKQRG